MREILGQARAGPGKVSDVSHASLPPSPSMMITLTFHGEIWVVDSEARSGYTQVAASNCKVKWDALEYDLGKLKPACYRVAMCDITGQSLETLLVTSNKGSKVRGEWTCWIASNRNFPKTAKLRVKLSEDNCQAWLKEAYGSTREAGLSYSAYHPKKIHQQANLVSLTLVVHLFFSHGLISFLHTQVARTGAALESEERRLKKSGGVKNSKKKKQPNDQDDSNDESEDVMVRCSAQCFVGE